MSDKPITVTSIPELISKVDEIYSAWNTKNRCWFRGEPSKTAYALAPKLHRKVKYDEFQLLKNFRIKAPTFLDIQVPQGQTDQWLFLAQHVSLPTRLLDWSEGLLIALYFALDKPDDKLNEGASVWMLDPIKLNRLTKENTVDNDFPITWYSPELDETRWIRELLKPDERALRGDKDFEVEFKRSLKAGRIPYNPGNQNIRAAWEPNNSEKIATKFPVAIHPTSIHPRITVQKGTLLIWGSDIRGLREQLNGKDNLLQQFVVKRNKILSMKKELAMLGITKSTLFPDLDSLAVDLAEMWKKDKHRARRK